MAEANCYALVSHLFWGVWSLIQAKYSTIDFDYVEYSKKRLAELKLRKTRAVEAVEKEFPPAGG